MTPEIDCTSSSRPLWAKCLKPQQIYRNSLNGGACAAESVAAANRGNNSVKEPEGAEDQAKPGLFTRSSTVC